MALMTLLRAGLWETSPDDLGAFPLTDACWENVFRMAQRQTVTGLVWRGINFLPDDLMPPEPLLLRWAAKSCVIERVNRKMNATVTELYAAFKNIGVTPVLQKGQGVAKLYRQPLLRECGDIDFYFPSRQESERALSLMCEKGCRPVSAADGSCHYRWNGFIVEHHLRLFDVSDPFKHSFIKRLERVHGFRMETLCADGTATVRTPAPMLVLLLLNTHILKHAIGRGIGLRQLCDMARAYHHYHKDISLDEAAMIYDKVGVGKWSALLHAFLREHLGVSSTLLPRPERNVLSRRLSDSVMANGNFGLYAAGRPPQRQTAWRRKLHTSRAFLNNVRMSCRFAPQEAFWTFINLLIGQPYAKR